MRPMTEYQNLWSLVDYQQYAGTYDVPRCQISPVLRETLGVSRLTVNTQAESVETALPFKPKQLLGDWVTTRIGIVSKKHLVLKNDF